MEIASWSTAVDNLEVQQQQNLFFSHIKLTKYLFLCELIGTLPASWHSSAEKLQTVPLQATKSNENCETSYNVTRCFTLNFG